MKLVVFGLTMSSSWGNGHATLWRGLCRALAAEGHRVVFFERDVPYYAAHRDLPEPEGCDLRLYRDFDDARAAAARELSSADAAMVTSYCPDAVDASELVLSSSVAARAFYDMDTPVTLEHLRAGERVPYLPPQGLGDFDLVLSFAGGRALEELETRLGARRAAPLYGSFDPDVHRPVRPRAGLGADLSYLGTYAADRHASLHALLLEPARQKPDEWFVIAGPLYPVDFPWRDNVAYIPHLAPPDHAAFYCSSRLTLNITRGAMALMGHCPSGRIFEAAGCGAPVMSDAWDGLEEFFAPGREILVASTTAEALEAVSMPEEELALIGDRARERALDEHTAAIRARQLCGLLGDAGAPMSIRPPARRRPRTAAPHRA